MVNIIIKIDVITIKKLENKLHQFIKNCTTTLPGGIDIVVKRFEIGSGSSYAWMYTNTIREQF